MACRLLDTQYTTPNTATGDCRMGVCIQVGDQVHLWAVIGQRLSNTDMALGGQQLSLQ